MENPLKNKYPQVNTVNDQERVAIVKEIFSTITGKYDFLNHLLSLRRDVAWRRFAIKKMNFFRTKRFLDIACGTGDLSIGAALHYPSIQITGIDFVAEMLQAGKNKAAQRDLADRINLLQADALQLPFNDNAFDVTGIAFGIRNIPDRVQALREMLRVTVPGGQVMVLEMTFIQNRFFKLIYHVYLNYLLPTFAKFFSKNPAAYYYLADSIMNFPAPAAFARLMEDTGMRNVKKYPLTFGVTYLHIGEKPQAGLP
ncbi:MAG: bifunctional demethylmenaquinone methyltransferase/2-methoxy-6-polyprenyl-1,4-benzoquinol methylase UbiE [Smithellaceae bacterium]